MNADDSLECPLRLLELGPSELAGSEYRNGSVHMVVRLFMLKEVSRSACSCGDVLSKIPASPWRLPGADDDNKDQRSSRMKGE